ncbi:MAG TPA: DUF2298 domain-containing protein [Thermomicrobiales bacterium]|nr:DUF2298 domain-containing protein [Thermomicrobiales bacterium]
MFSSLIPRFLLAASDGLLDQPPGDLPAVDDARWSVALTSNSFAALGFWIVMLIVLQVAVWPLVRVLFSSLPDRGWGFGRLLTVILAVYPLWLLASIQVMSFRAVWCGLAVVVVAVVSWFGAWRFLPEPQPGAPWYRTPAILGAELVFWGFFAWFLAYRFINPDSWHTPWGGEKPMELAHLNAILRTAHFPPHDPWYAGGTLNYYYFGAVLIAFMLKLTGIPSEIGFNLAQPTIIAIIAAGTWSVGCGLAWTIARTTKLTMVGGALAVLLVNVAGNLVVASRLIAGIGGTRVSLNDYVYWFWDPRQIVPRTINEFPYFTATYADLHAHVIAMPMTMLVVGISLALVSDARSVLLVLGRPRANGRLLARLVIQLLIAALVLGTLYMTNAWDVPVYAAVLLASLLLATRYVRSLWRRVGVSVVLAMTVGVIAMAAALPFITNFFSRYGELGRVSDTSPLVTIEAHFGVFLLVMIFGLSTLAASRWQRSPVLAHPAVFSTVLAAVLVWRWSVADSSDSLIDLADGVTVLVVTGWLLIALVASMPRLLDFGIPRVAVRTIAFAGWLAVIWALATDRTAFGFLVGVGLAASMVWIQRGNPGIRFAAMLIAAAMFVAAGVELIYIVDDLGGGVWYRMNTVFKFYNSAWVMSALGASALLVFMIREVLRPIDIAVPVAVQSGSVPARATTIDFGLNVPHRDEYHTDLDASGVTGAQDPGTGLEPGLVSTAGRWAPAWSQFGLAIATIAIVAALAYPVFATGVRLNQRFPQDGRHWTLNSLDWMDYGEIDAGAVNLTYAGDRAAIEWLNDNVGGTPVIAEAVLDAYACAGSRISIHTGLPAVVGWTWHETQQRGVTGLFQREEDVRDLYTSADPVLIEAVINRYDIEYIVVGDLERWYPASDCRVTDNSDGISAIDSLVGSRLEVAFELGGTVIYRVVGP